ncbi:hypothetical protein Tco_0313821 [Tanacetum coccineum]
MVECAKLDEEANIEEDQGNEAVEDTNTDLDGRDDVMTVVILPQHLEDNSRNSDKSNNMLKRSPPFWHRCSISSEIKMQEAVGVAVQLRMKKIIKEQVKKEVSKITPKIEKLVTDQLESEVLVRSSKEANTSHAVAANLSELELKKILIGPKWKLTNSINRSDIQRKLYKAFVVLYEADKILLDTYGDTVTIKRPRDGADDDQEPSAGTDRGSKRRRSGKEPDSTSAPSETTTKTAGKTTSTGSKTHRKSASQSAPVEEAMQTTDVFEALAYQKSFHPAAYGRSSHWAIFGKAIRRKLTHQKPDTYRSNLRRQGCYTHTQIQEDSFYENKVKRTD